MPSKCIICGQKAKLIIDGLRYCQAHEHVASDQAILDALGSAARISLSMLRRRLVDKGWDLTLASYRRKRCSLRRALERLRDEGFVVRVPRHGRGVKSVTYWRAA